MRRVRDCNLFYGRIPQALPSVQLRIAFGVGRHPQNNFADAINGCTVRLGESRLLKLSWIFVVRGKKHIQRRPVLNLRIEISTRTVCDVNARSGLSFEGCDNFWHRTLQIGSRRNTNRFLLCEVRLHQTARCKYHQRRFAEYSLERHFVSDLRPSYTRRIITSVDLISAAARSPGFSRISFAASAVMMDVMCCSPIASVTCARIPLYLMATTRPINWLRPLILRNWPRRKLISPRSSFLGIRRSISLSGTR